MMRSNGIISTRPLEAGISPISPLLAKPSFLELFLNCLGLKQPERPLSCPPLLKGKISLINSNQKFFEDFQKIRFSIEQINKLSEDPFPWPGIEEQFLRSGSRSIDSHARKQFLEWKFSQIGDFTAWINDLPQGTTFSSTAFPLTFEEGSALVTLYRHIALTSKPLSQAESASLQQLKEKIDTLLTKLKNTSSQGFFIRLDSRSPKDAPLYPGIPQYQKLKDLVEQDIAKLDATDLPSAIKTHKRQAILAERSVEVLAIQSGEEAIQILSNSERVYRDLSQALNFPNLWNMQAIIRPFTKIPYAMEFRGFVFNHKLTALSQYDQRLYFTQLVSPATQTAIVEKITNFFQKNLQTAIPFSQYVIDFGLVKKEEKEDEIGDPIVIEINPFEPTTGPALFSWEDDREILEGSHLKETNLPAFRVVNSPETPPPILFPDWEPLLNPVHHV